jgi:xanthine dehydrogenase large subunit
VAIDTLTGESRVLKVDILHDVGNSINPAIYIGQIEGGFIQGMGWLTTEQLVWNQTVPPELTQASAPPRGAIYSWGGPTNKSAGYLQTHAPSTYKIPTTGDLPAHFQVDLWPEANIEDNVHGSKAVGEPPFMLAISVFEALRDAVAQAGGQPEAMNAPATAEEVLRAVGG